MSRYERVVRGLQGKKIKQEGKDERAIGNGWIAETCGSPARGDLPGNRRRDGGIGQVGRFDAVDLDHLAAGRLAGWLLARHISLELLVNYLAAGNELLLHEAKRTGADDLGNLRVRVRVGDPLRHHERNVAVDLAERIQHETHGLLQHQLERVVVDGLDTGNELPQGAPHAVLGGPALDRGDAVGRAHRRVIVPLEAVAQLERIGKLVVADRPAVHHLRLRHVVDVESK
jgi:hypothetical protein